jgi:hypothetical protein
MPVGHLSFGDAEFGERTQRHFLCVSDADLGLAFLDKNSKQLVTRARHKKPNKLETTISARGVFIEARLFGRFKLIFSSR